ncbi:MAG: putative enzyme related to lactoylglutathione lyase [Flavobacterium sp.]|jgi:predicted enzyme related to lactoylglutathione lyase
MHKSTNSLSWFEIPATDLARAQTFYETIFDISLEETTTGKTKMALFPVDTGSGKVIGALVQSPYHIPSNEGSVIYLNANPSMDKVMSRVNAAGGKIVVPKTSVDKYGNIAFIIDSEGNKVGIHSIN